jgi:acetyl esterase/lipase
MTFSTLPPIARATLMALAFALTSFPALAQVTIFSPFNIVGAIDDNVVKIGDNVPYADGTRKKLDVYAPKNPTGPSPVVMFIYGGAWKAGDKFEYEFVGRALAASGFVAVIADYRLYPEVKYPDFLEDNAQALRWIQDNIATYGGDPQRVFLAGHSAGAYNAIMLGLDPSFRRDYGVTIPILGVAGLSGPYDFYPFEYNEVQTIFGDAPSAEGTQPINLVTSDAPPIWLGSGTTDPIVREENTQHLAKKLKDQGLWVTERYYEGMGHLEPIISMGKMWRWRAPVLADMVAFFTTFGAFPSGVPELLVTPEPAQAAKDPIDTVIAGLDQMFAPVDN